jgi:Na+/proline symporter
MLNILGWIMVGILIAGGLVGLAAWAKHETHEESWGIVAGGLTIVFLVLAAFAGYLWLMVGLIQH